jgi:hypothetical protein
MPGSSITINRQDEISERIRSAQRAAFQIRSTCNQPSGSNIHNLPKGIGLIA